LSDPQIRCETLPSGLTVLCCETHLAPVVELQVWARVGSADERPGEAGLAHFHEHMLFKGTARRGVGEIAGEVEGAGGRINAFTSLDVTVYHATLPSDELALGIDVLSDAVLHSAFEADEIDREIEVVLEEIRRSEDSPAHVLGNAVFAETFRVHPYGAPILGTPESVAGFDRPRVRAFFERWYTPDNLLVVAAGAFERGALLPALEAAFPGSSRRAPARRRAPEPAQTALRSVLLARPFECASLDLTWPSVGLASPDAALLDLLAFVLGGCESSRLVRRVKEREGLVDRVDASCYTPLDPGYFSVTLETDADRALEASEAILREVERVRRGAVSGAELETARVNFLAMEDFERESVSGQAGKLGSFQVLAGSTAAERDYLERVRSATADDLRRVAEVYLAPERLTAGVLLPEADAGAVDAARLAEAVERGVARTARSFAVPAARSRAEDLVSYALPGGGRLHVVPRRAVPVVAARAAFLGGLLAEEAPSSGLTSFLAAMWTRGTRSRSAADFARSAESLAAEIEGFSGRSSLGVTLEAPSQHLDPALDLLAEVLLEPAFDRDEVERERRETLAAIERREDRLAQRAFLLFAETLFREHPYRRPLLGTRDTVARFDDEALRAHHERLIRARNLVVAVAGDVDPDDVAARISARLADLDPGPFEPPALCVEPAPDAIRSAELRKDRAQAHLVIGFRGLTLADPDRDALELIAQLLAGQGGRLFLELRDRRSLAYTVSATNVEGLAPGWFAAYIATAPDKVEEARSGLLAELERLLQEAPDELELERARRHLIGGFAIDQQRNAFHASQVALNDLYGLGPDADRRYAERIRAVTTADVLRVARRVIDLDAYTLALVRP
jgi:zinc protease